MLMRLRMRPWCYWSAGQGNGARPGLAGGHPGSKIQPESPISDSHLPLRAPQVRPRRVFSLVEGTSSCGDEKRPPGASAPSALVVVEA